MLSNLQLELIYLILLTSEKIFSDDDQIDGGVTHLPMGTIHSHKSHRTSTMGPRPPGTTNGLSLDLPVDDEDYLMPSPQSPFTGNNNNHVTNTYMDLLSDPKGSSMFQYPPPQNYFLTGNFDFAPCTVFISVLFTSFCTAVITKGSFRLCSVYATVFNRRLQCVGTALMFFSTSFDQSERALIHKLFLVSWLLSIRSFHFRTCMLLRFI